MGLILDVGTNRNIKTLTDVEPTLGITLFASLEVTIESDQLEAALRRPSKIVN